MCGNGWGPLELPLDGGVVLGGRPGLTRKPFASRIPYSVARAPVLINTLTCTLNPTPNPKPRLNAGSKPKAEHTLQILPKPLSTRSLIPFNRKPKTHKLKLNPKPQNPTTTPQGEEGPHTPHHRGGGAPPYIQTIYLWGGEGDHIHIHAWSFRTPPSFLMYTSNFKQFKQCMEQPKQPAAVNFTAATLLQNTSH